MRNERQKSLPQGTFAFAKPGDNLGGLIGPAGVRVVRVLAVPRRSHELARELRVAASAASEHLKGLPAAGIVRRFRRDRGVFYVVTRPGANSWT